MNNKTQHGVASEMTEKRGRGRPPLQEGARQETRERFIRCGIELLTEQGFASTGIEAILSRVGVPKGSFYHYFSSKDEFGQAVIDGYAEYFGTKLDSALLNERRAPLDRLRDFVADARQGMKRHSYKRGCLIGNMGQELGSTHDVFREQLEKVFLDWQHRVERCLHQARDAGEIRSDADCVQLAAFFWIGWEGAILRAKLVRNAEPLDLFTETFFAGIDRQ